MEEYAPEPVNLLRVMSMLLLHDIVEVDAGDTYCYDEQANLDKEEREQAAATRIFKLLPEDTALEFRALWEEFEERRTADAKFANALDRFQPLLHNYLTGGVVWIANGIRRAAVDKRMAPLKDGAPQLWEYTKNLLDNACAQGFLLE
jgi:putative hydrolase of HD superfamily